MRKKIINLQTLAYIILTMNLSAQYSGTINVPNATFGNLSVLVDSLNAYGLNGALTVNVTAAQTAPAGGYLLGNTGSALLTTLSATNSLTLNGGGNTITSFTPGTRNVTGTTTGQIDAIFNLVGADFVTIKRFTFSENSANTNNTQAMEAAVALFNVGSTAGSANGCQFITIDSNTVNFTNLASTGEGGFAFAAYPYIFNTTTAASWTGNSSAIHRSFQVTNNTINQGYNGVLFRGSTSAQARALIVINNKFLNLGGATTSGYGVYTLYLDSMIANSNEITFDVAHTTGTLYGVFQSTNCGNNSIINSNNINLSNTGTSQTAGISISSHLGIRSSIKFNKITGNVPNLTTSALQPIIHTYGGGNSYTLEIDSNEINNITVGGTATIAMISAGNSTTLGNTFVRGNIINNINRTGGNGATYGIQPVTGSLDAFILRNTIDSIYFSSTTTATSITLSGVHSTGTHNNFYLENNTITNLFINGTNTATAHTVRGFSGSNTATSQFVTNNVISDLRINTAAAGGGTLEGIYTLPATTGVSDMRGNRVFKLNMVGSGTTANGVRGLSTGGSNTIAINNIVSELSAPASINVNGVIGLNFSGTMSALTCHSNTVAVGFPTSITSSGANFGVSGIFIGSAATPFIASNNIVNVKATRTGTGTIAALRRVSGTAGTKPAGFTLSHNIWRCGTTAASENYIFIEGTATTFTNAYHIGGGSLGTNDASFNSACGAYKAWMGDIASFTEDSLIAGGTAGTWVPNSASLAQNSAVTLGGITTDHSGASRNATTPDRGALEFAGTAGQDLVPPTISFTDVPNLNCTNAPTISATITDASGVNTTSAKPRLYYKFLGNVNDSVTNTSAANGWKWIESNSSGIPYTFTFDFSKLNVAVAADSVIQYFIVAQDLATVPNIANNSVTFNTGFCPSSVSIRQAGFPVSGVKSFKITSPTIETTVSPITVCNNNNDTLVTRLNRLEPVTIGTITNTVTSISPYQTNTSAGKRQLSIYRATELQAQGLTAGPIASISWTVTAAATPAALSDFTIKMGNVPGGPASLLVGTSVPFNYGPGGMTTCIDYSVSPLTGYTPSVGVNTHNFTTPFIWDGVSNVLVETCLTNPASGSSYSVNYTSISNGITVYTTSAGTNCTTVATATLSTFRPVASFVGNKSVSAGLSYVWKQGVTNLGINNDTAIVQPNFPTGIDTLKYDVAIQDPSGCIFRDTVAVIKNKTLPTISAKSLSNTFPCFGDSITVNSTVLNGCPPYLYNYTIATTLGGAKSPLLLSSTNKFFPNIDKGYVYLLITDNNNQKDSTLIDSFQLPAVPTAVHDTVCGTGQATIGVTGITNGLWYTKNNLTTPFQTSGTSFTTPVLTTTDTFYVSNRITFDYPVGSKTPGTLFNIGASPRGIRFDLTQAMSLDSIGIMCSGNAGTATVQVFDDAGTTAMSPATTLTIAATGTRSLQSFKVGFPVLPIGTYRIMVTAYTGTSPFVYESSFSGFPLPIINTASTTVGNIISSATSQTAGVSATTYYYFYRLVFGEKCESRKIPVYAVLGSAPALTLSSGGPLQICNTTTNTTIDTVKVTSNKTSFNSYTWNPPAAVGDSSKGWVYTTTRNGQDTFTLTALNTLTNCQQIRRVLVNPAPYISTINTTTNIDTHCISGSSTITITGSPTLGATYQWESSPNGTTGWSPIGSAINSSYITPNINSTTFYRAIISCSGSPISGGGVSPTAVKQIVVNNPSMDSVKHDTICGIDSAQLRAFTAAPKVIQWYDKNGNYLDTGSIFNTPVLLGTDTFYAAAAALGSSYNAVKNVATATPPGTGGNAALANYGFNITLTKPIILNSIDVFSGTGTSMTVTLYNADGSSILNTTTATTTAGVANTIPLGWLIPPGTYRFGTPAMTGEFWRENTGNTIPVALGTSGSVNGPYLGNIATVASAFSTTSPTWNYAYNWSIREMCSSSPRIPVIATVTPPPALTFTKDVDSVCSGQLIDSVKLSAGAASYTSFTWSSIPAATAPSGNIATTGVRVTNTTPGDYKYVINAEQTTGSLCKNSDTFYLKVKRIPLPIVSSPSGTLNLCNGTIQELNASSKLIDSAIVGTGTVNIGSASGNPFRPGAGNTNHRLQYLISAAEINATSLQAEAITALGFKANNVSTGTMTNYQIRLGHTSATTLSTAFLTQPSTLVHSVGAYGPTIVGWNMFYFNQSNVFEWNGTDNVLVEICYTTTTGITATVVGGPVAGVAIPTVHETAATCGTTATGTTIVNRPHIRLVQNVKNPITWSPTAGLFTNAVASSAYTSGARDTVWSKHNDTIKYYMTATHPNGCAIKDSIVLNVKDTVTINTQPPAFAVFCAGDTLKLSVTASSTSPITYQWKKNGLNISTALNASAGTPILNIPNATQTDSGTYEVDITTGAPCGTKTSIASTVKVRLPITITTQPNDNNVCVGSSFCLSAAAMNDSSRVWTQLTGANTGTNNTLCISSSAYADSGRYFISYIPQTPCPTKNSDTVRVIVLPPALIAADPASLTTLCIGDSVTLKATHTGAL
ncbi:MAG: hypothetical protein ACK5UE_01395, partial [Chitinophagales bacterium]